MLSQSVICDAEAQAYESASRIAVELVLELGRDFENEDYALGRVLDVEPSRVGNIVILDALERNVKIFDGNGRLRRTLGRSGQGPGEFTHPFYMSVSKESVTIMDWMQRKTITFALDGGHLETRRLPGVSVSRLGYGVFTLEDGLLLVVTAPNFSTNPAVTDLFTTIFVHDSRQGKNDTLARIRTEAVSYRTAGPAAALRVASTGFWRWRRVVSARR